jgi:hypothetical protein
VRVFGKGLEAAATKGRALDVDGRTEEDVGAFRATFFAKLDTDFFGEGNVEGRGETGCARETV